MVNSFHGKMNDMALSFAQGLPSASYCSMHVPFNWNSVQQNHPCDTFFKISRTSLRKVTLTLKCMANYIYSVANNFVMDTPI